MNSSIRVDPELVAALPDEEITELKFAWWLWGRASQMPPRGDWTTWLLMGGRGSGKTRAGAEWVRNLAERGVSPIALVGETIAEAIAIMVRGHSGLLSVHRPEMRPVLKGGELQWTNGVIATLLPASDPERFRGPQFAAAWCDELGSGRTPRRPGTCCSSRCGWGTGPGSW